MDHYHLPDEESTSGTREVSVEEYLAYWDAIIAPLKSYGLDVMSFNPGVSVRYQGVTFELPVAFARELGQRLTIDTNEGPYHEELSEERYYHRFNYALTLIASVQVEEVLDHHPPLMTAGRSLFVAHLESALQKLQRVIAVLKGEETR